MAFECCEIIIFDDIIGIKYADVRDIIAVVTVI